MSIKTLLSDELWVELASEAEKHIRIHAAISYVTANHLNFRDSDLLICDASDDAIKGGLTSATTLRSFFDQGAKIYSYSGLHSKVAVIDDKALIGSANLSENAGVGTCEASLLTDDIQIVGLISGFIERLRSESVPVDSKFLQRIEALPVVRASGISRRSKKKIEVGKSRVWFIATRSLSDKIINAEEAFEQEGREEAEKRVVRDGYSVWSVRWTGKSRFRLEAKPGDLVIEAFTEKRGKSKYIQVFRAAPILHRQDTDKWTRFYLEIPPDAPSYLWKDVKADFESIGVSNITPNSTRELTGKALDILARME
ncbi:MAG: phospholipase D-like domain-containing protein [Nitrosomonas sp.]|nr:hypothetical protein [Nitrosomonas sp.]MCG7757403.1 phospholipase D-like domain-containing protein [Nitrosomonas sp.]